MKNRQIIYLLGTDGSGKTTNALQLVNDGIGDFRLAYLYIQYMPILILPLKLIAKLFFKKTETFFGDYDGYSKRKKKYASKLKALTRMYCLIWYFDHIVQIYIKLFFVRLKKPDIIIIDRYYLDSVVNLACLQNLNHNQMLADAKKIENLLPKASYHVYLDVSEAEAFRRKNDIPSIDYLRERRNKYLSLAPVYDFLIINADNTPETVYKEIRSRLKDSLPSLYF